MLWVFIPLYGLVIYIAYKIYLDAQKKGSDGVAWFFISIIFPGAGWLFYGTTRGTGPVKNDNIQRAIPGFRSGKWWKKILTIMIYLIIFAIPIISSEDSVQSKKQPAINKFNDKQYFSHYYQPRANLTVGINDNLELMQIAAAHSADFKHNGYAASDSEINRIVKDYYSKYPKKDYETDLYKQSMDGVVDKLYHGETDYILCYDKQLNKMILNTGRPDQFAAQGKLENKDGLISVMKDFRTYTKADTFFAANKKEYEEILNNYRTQFGFDYVGQIQELTGMNMDNAIFKLVLSPSMEGGMAVSLKDHSGKDVYINISNPTDTYENTLMTIYHEGIHNFIVPVLMKRWSEYDNQRFVGVLNSNDNGNALNETLTRALTVLIIEKNHPNVNADEMLALSLRTGWINTDKVYYLLKNEYINNRAKYKTIEDFMPRLVDYLDQMKKQP